MIATITVVQADEVEEGMLLDIAGQEYAAHLEEDVFQVSEIRLAEEVEYLLFISTEDEEVTLHWAEEVGILNA